MKQLLCTLITVFFSLSIFAQREPDKVYMQNIKGIKLFHQGNQASYPILALGATMVLALHFDDITTNIKNYSYTYQLCNADWQPVDLSEMDYIQGFLQNRLTQYRASSIAEIGRAHV